MAECPGRLEELSALLDGELPPEQELALRRHLDECALCAAWRSHLETLAAGAAEMAGAGGRVRAPRTLARRVARLAVPPAAAGPLGRLVHLVRFAGRPRTRLAGVLAMAGAALLLLFVVGRGEAFLPALLEDHHRLVSGQLALAVPSSDPEEVARGLAARLPFRVAVAEIPGAHLRGGHACSLPGRRAAYLQYERGGERVSVFVYPRQAGEPAGETPCRGLGESSLCAFAGEHETVAVVASRPETARAFREAAHVVESP